MQGILPEAEKQVLKVADKIKDTAEDAKQTASDFVHGKVSFLKIGVLGPIYGVVVLSVALSLLGFLLPCLGCFPVRLTLLCTYVFAAAAVLLYKFIKAECDSRNMQDIALMALMPTLVFGVTVCVVALLSTIIPVIGLLPILPGAFASLLAATAFSAALTYSRSLLSRRACLNETSSNIWTFYQ